MHGMTGVVAILVLSLLASSAPWSAYADEWWEPTKADLYVLYERLRPGMTATDVAVVAGRASLSGSSDPVTSWLIWNPPVAERPTTVLRASFRDGRLARVQYESFGEQYRRLVKGGELGVEIEEKELRRLWRQTSRLTQTVEHCHEALEAFHRLVLRAQDRLTTAEQAAWVRALALRRAAEAEFGMSKP